MSKTVFLFSFLLLLSAFSCSSTPEQNETIPPDMFITLERTPCFGMCPAYRLTIAADGEVVFEGRSNTKVKGLAKTTISSDQLKELLAEFEKIDYFSLKDSYRTQEDCPMVATDSPSAITSLKMRGQEKGVHHYHGCHGLDILKDLRKLEDRIDEIVNTKQWISNE